MDKISRVLRQTLSLVVLLVWASASQAVIATDIRLFDNTGLWSATGQTTNNNVEASNENVTPTFFAGFNPIWGTLNSMRITYETTHSVYGALNVVDPETCFFCEENVLGGGFVSSTIALVLSMPHTVAEPTSQLSASLQCNDDDGSCRDTVHTGVSQFDGTLFETSDAAILSQFIDNAFSINAFNRSTARVTFCDDDEDLCSVSARSDFSGSLSVAYTYTPSITQPVPESASFALIALGLAGLGFSRRRRSSRLTKNT